VWLHYKHTDNKSFLAETLQFFDCLHGLLIWSKQSKNLSDFTMIWNAIMYICEKFQILMCFSIEIKLEIIENGHSVS
jgi:hypothetical protein